MSNDLHFKTASELAAMIRAKQVGCVELLEHFLKRCDAHNKALNAIVVFRRDEALARAGGGRSPCQRGELGTAARRANDY